MTEQDKERARRFGEYIRALRKARGLTQDELSKALGYTHRAAVSQLEKGKNDIAFDRLPALSAALGVEPQELLTAYAGTTDKDTNNLAQIEAVKGMLKDLTPAQLDQITAIIRVMQDQNKGGVL